MSLRRAFALLTAAALLAPGTARARPPDPGPLGARVPAPGLGKVDTATAYRLAEALRGAGATGSLAGVLRATAALAGWDLGAPPAPAASLPVRGLPPAIGALLAEVMDAERLMRVRTASLDPAIVQEALGIDPHDRKALRRIAHGARGLDLPEIARTAARIGAAIDRVIVQVPSLPRSGRAAAECDVYQQAPQICVGGNGANTYTSEFNLTVDLGGNDVYRNAGGVGACLAAGVVNTRCVGVVVDLGGDDTHAPAEIANCGAGVVCGQGTASAGIGMLVDVAGDDTYTTTGVLGPATTTCTETQWCGHVAAQGVGSLGAGVMADLAGDDRYAASFRRHAVGPDGIEAPETLVAQGVAILGTGLLWDAAGDDTYEIRGHATGYVDPDAFQPWSMVGTSGAAGQGVALAGAGGMLEGGGRDDLLIRMEPDPDAADATRPSPWGQGGVGDVAGQGLAEAFAHEPIYGALVTGDGDTTYALEARARLGSPNLVFGQGVGLFGGANGIVDDAGGNDTYRLSAETVVDLGTRCDCEEAKAIFDTRADPFLDSYGLGQATTRGQGGPMGSVRDRAGNDSYLASATSDVTIVAENTRPGGRAAAGTKMFGGAAVLAQGYEPGHLRDDAGNDRYTLSGERHVRAIATAAPDAEGARDEEAWTFPGFVTVVGQAVGLGANGTLTDLGGQDRYESIVDGSGRAIPDPGGHASDGSADSVVQGTDGSFTDVDGGQQDSFRAESTLVFDSCVGEYGVAPGWISGPPLRDADCIPTWGNTVATSTLPAGGTPSLTFQQIGPMENEDGDFPFLSLALRLTDPAGVPLVGRAVWVNPEFGYRDSDPLVDQLYEWINPTLGSARLVTDADGIARGNLSMRMIGCEPNGCSGLTGQRRLRAIVFNEPGLLRPARAYAPLPDVA